MTDLPGLDPATTEALAEAGIDLAQVAIPSRLGTTISVDGAGGLIAHLVPRPATTVHGVVRASVVAFLVDAVAGLAVDTDPEAWTFTSDLSLRLPPRPAPASISAVTVPLRTGRRSVTAEVPLTGPAGEAVGHAAIGFARLERRPGDPDKPVLDLAAVKDIWDRIPPIDGPLRDEVGVRSLDPAAGVVELELRDTLRNPAGALQGAMVALAVECAAEDLAGHALGPGQVVTDLDLRFLAQARLGPVRSRARFVGDPADGTMVVELVDAGGDERLVTTAYARTRPAPPA